MPESIEQATVEKVAKLARISLTDARLDEASQQLAKILGYVGQLEEVDTENVEPFFGAIESVNAIRDDVVTPSIDRETILSNAPKTDGEFYQVPPVFER